MKKIMLGSIPFAGVLRGVAGIVAAQQPTNVPRIGFQLDAPPFAVTARIEAFRQGLREL